VDDVSSFGAFRQRMEKEFGPNVKVLKKYEDQAEPEIDFNNPFAMFQMFTKMMEGVPATPSNPGIGLVFAEGPIIVGTSDDDPFSGATVGSTTVRAALHDALEAEHVRAVVLRIDSPGGSSIASDIIWKAAAQVAEKKPLIVSMGGVAASGGYYIAVPADTIYAEAGTITGSIGVLGGKFVWKELMEEKLGITTTVFARGDNATLMSPNEHWTPDEEKEVQALLDKIYGQFKGRVQDGRGRKLTKELEELAGGRVYTGTQALELGLVDEIGGLEDALATAAKRADLDADCDVYVFPKPSELAALMDILSAMSGGDDRDEFEIGVRTALLRDPLLRAALPLMKELAPSTTNGLKRVLRDMWILNRERAGCMLPLAIEVR
jgi:protease-4